MTGPIDYTAPYVEVNTGGGIPVEDSPNFSAEYGPDHTAPKSENMEEPNKETPKGKKPFGNLGNNKKVRSGVRQLTNKDKDAITSLYAYLGMGLMPFKPATALKVGECSEQCAEAWFDLARENDAVRRAILAIIEGGAWGKIFAAHLPILLTLIPENHPLSMIANMGDIPDDTSGLGNDN